MHLYPISQYDNHHNYTRYNIHARRSEIFFLAPKSPKHRQYEALRAYAIDETPAAGVAQRFGFTENTLYALARDLRAGTLEFFSQYPTGPKDRRVAPYIRERIVEWRKNRLSVADITGRFCEENIAISSGMVERILKDAGFGKLPRRTAAQRDRTKKNTFLSQTRS